MKTLVKNALRGFKRAKAVKAPPQPKPAPKSWVSRNKAKLAGSAGLVSAGALSSTASDNLFGKDKAKNNKESVNIYVIQKRTNVKQNWRK